MRTRLRQHIASVLTVACSLATNTAIAQDSSFNLPAQPLADSLRAVAGQTNSNILFNAKEVAGFSAKALKAKLSQDAALQRLLQGTGLTYKHLDEKTVAVGSLARTGLNTDRAMERLVRLAQSDMPTKLAVSDVARDDGMQLEEVVVTATKRSQRLEDVPMSVAVVGKAELEHRNLTGMEDYLPAIPGVSQIDNGVAGNSITIRGITLPGSGNSSTGPTVATYFDEAPMTGSGGFVAGEIDLRPVDIDRIEVLRGPQGTAYGSASLGGAVRIIPTKPQLDAFGAKVAGYYSNTSRYGSDNSMFEGVLNVPLVSDTLALRAVAYRYDESGIYRNIAGLDPTTLARADKVGLENAVRGFVKGDIGQLLSTGGRFSALWKPTDKLEVSFNFVAQVLEQDGTPTQSLAVANVGAYQQINFPNVDPRVRLLGKLEDVLDNRIHLGNIVVNYDVDWATLVTSLSRIDSGTETNGSGVGDYPTSVPYGLFNKSDFNSFSAETRLASKLRGPFQFLVGLFFEKTKDNYTAAEVFPADPSLNTLTDPLVVDVLERDVKQRAIFGELSYNILDPLTATFGGRYYKYDKHQNELLGGGFFGSDSYSALSNGEGGESFKANLAYRPSARAMLYASWAQGFRLGQPAPGLVPGLCDKNNDGRDDYTGVSIASTRVIASDTLNSFEIGSKLTLLDRRLEVSAALYHINWKGLPALTSTQCGGVTYSYTVNAGAATSNGGELQATMRVTSGLQLDAGLGYNRGVLSRDAANLGATDGARLPGAPAVNANLAAQYNFEVVGRPVYVRADSLYVSKYYGDFAQTPALGAGDYGKIDLRAGATIDNLLVELFVRNLTNEQAFTAKGYSYDVAPYIGYRLRPRTIGLQLGYSFH